MPRKSPFDITLSREEYIALENQVRQYTSPYCDVIRAKIVLLAWTRRARLSASGASDSPSRGFLAWSRNLGAGVPPSSPPSVVVQVKALACELPHRLQLPLSRLSLSEIRREVITQGLVAEISGATLWRWLSADALRPWRHRSWIFPRDPDFAAKAGRILDLYDRVWQGRPLNSREV